MEEIYERRRRMMHSLPAHLKYRRHGAGDVVGTGGGEEIQSTQEGENENENEQAEGSEGVVREAQHKLEEVLRQIANNDATIEVYYQRDDEHFLPGLRRYKKALHRERIILENQIRELTRD